MKSRRGEQYADTMARWAERLAPSIKTLLRATEGRAFVLFTSSAAMNATYDLVAPLCRELNWTVLVQGQLSKGETIQQFKDGTSPVLFATASFWEGVDVPGSQLSIVIIDKLPFPRRDPLGIAKRKQFGKEAFEKYDIPLTIQTLKQGVGRLIRTETDRGIISILDPRVHKSYGRKIMAALPGRAVDALNRTQPLDITGFLDGKGQRSAECVLEEWAANGLAALARLDPDEAHEKNSVGFSASDSSVGHRLAETLAGQGGLSDRQWSQATNLLRKYHKQIGIPPAGEVA